MGYLSHIEPSLRTVFLLLLLIAETAFSYPHYEDVFSEVDNPELRYTYSRFPEIEKHCGFLISSTVEFLPDDNRGERLKKELSFKYGDWYQELGRAPLLPMDNRELPSNTFGSGPPLKLVSFWLKDVDPIRRAKNTVSVSGVMEIGIFRTVSLSYKPYDWSPSFYMRVEYSKLTIIFEGVYLESQQNGGRGLMCLLGTATIPTNSSQKVDDSCDLKDPRSSCHPQVQPSNLQDDQILLVLQYPKTFSLTTREVNGEMKSLNPKGSQTYFDKVHISSQLGQKSKYQFGSEEILSNSCCRHPYHDPLTNEDIEIYKGNDYCEKLRGLVWNEIFEFEFTWKNARKIGPFSLDEEIEATYKSSNKLKLMFQELYCEPGTDQNGNEMAMCCSKSPTELKIPQKRRDENRSFLPDAFCRGKVAFF